MEVLIGMLCTAALIAGMVFMFFGALGDSRPSFIFGFGLAVGGIGFALNAFGMDFYLSMGLSAIGVAGGVIWFFKR